MAAQATAVVGVALQLDAPSLNEPLLAFLATRAGITALCAAIVSRHQRASAAALARHPNSTLYQMAPDVGHFHLYREAFPEASRVQAAFLVGALS